MSDQTIPPFLQHLFNLTENKGAMAALKRGVAFSPGAYPPQFPHVLPFVPSGKSDKVFFITASLFGLHPVNTGTGNLGLSLHQLKLKKKSESLDIRFNALLQCRFEDLPNHLRNLFSLLSSEDIPVNFVQLHKDLFHWDHEDRFVQLKWAKTYWRNNDTN